MPRKKAGMGNYGKEKIRRNWEDIESGNLEGDYGWLTGETSDKNAALREQIKQANEQIGLATEVQEVETLPDLWPSKDNYYQGPSKSTRVSRHKFVPIPTATGISIVGTVYVEFTNMRPNGAIRRTDVYEYRRVPYPDYITFTKTTSKGQMINDWTKRFSYQNLNKDTSVFSS